MIRIPLTSPATGTVAAQPGLRLALPFAGATTGQRKTEVMRAVAAAVALATPRMAHQAVKVARDPDQDIGEIDRQHLGPVLQAVVRVQQDRSGASADNRQKEIAQLIGADPVLVAAAFSAINGSDDAILNSTRWVASGDPDLLERAAKAASLGLVPSHQDPPPQGQLEEIKAQLVEIGKKVEGLDKGMKDLDARVKKLEP